LYLRIIAGVSVGLLWTACENEAFIGYRETREGADRSDDATEPSRESDTGVDSDTGIDSDTGVESDTGVDSDTGVESDTTGADTDTASDTSGDVPEMLALSGDLRALDPSIILVEGTYYLFYTGVGIPSKQSTDLLEWNEDAPVFDAVPEWTIERVPEADEFWAPDISYFGDVYHLYYGVSSFGVNHSCIGHATTENIAAAAWTDHGPVICSYSEEDGDADDWNAIDPNVVLDDDGTPYMVFGSYWSGIKAIQLDPQGSPADDILHTISSRGTEMATAAPLIVKREEYYYHFVSFDRCCAGVESTHNIRVGRSSEVLGPYLDREGVDMREGGGTLMVAGDDRWHGPGHNAILLTDDGDYHVFHAYDDDGQPTLRISTIVWDAEAWPLTAGP
jgi:arabinan endo-1,5-alpha-L-arabinosidase